MDVVGVEVAMFFVEGKSAMLIIIDIIDIIDNMTWSVCSVFIACRALIS